MPWQVDGDSFDQNLFFFRDNGGEIDDDADEDDEDGEAKVPFVLSIESTASCFGRTRPNTITKLILGRKVFDLQRSL